MGGKTYVKDTAAVVNNIAVFKGEKSLEYGVYIIVEPGKNNFFEFLIDEKDQDFFVEADFTSDYYVSDLQGSEPNRKFQSYMKFMVQKKKEKDLLLKKTEAPESEKAKKATEAEVEKLDKAVKEKQLDIINSQPQSLLAKMLKASIVPEIPAFNGSAEEKKEKEYRWYKAHWFDNTDLKDVRLLRTAVLHEKIMYYIDKMTVQQPDSLIRSADEVLNKLKPAGETFKFYMAELLNKYARSRVVGEDAVYVHLALEYYNKLKPDWVEADQLKKIINDATRLKLLLIGKKAPELNLRSLNGTGILLHEFSAQYTVLFFYDTDCKSCKKQITDLKNVAEKYAAQVKVITICIGKNKKQEDISKFVQENGMSVFFNTYDPAEETRLTYDALNIPQIYILDQQKTILSKKIDAVQIEKVLKKSGL
jgi:peroxiredoxin